jgi:hypothetical protein
LIFLNIDKKKSNNKTFLRLNFMRRKMRMNIEGYGEDSLTLWALKNRLCDIMLCLEGSKVECPTAVFYRPSFGRGPGCFGEFDAIIANSENIYLIESKRNSRNEVFPEKQKNRHEILKKYFDAFRDLNIDELNAEDDIVWNKIQNKIKSKTPSAKSQLAKNILYIFRKLKDVCKNKKQEVRNVLLLFSKSKNKEKCSIKGKNPIKVTVPYSDDFVSLS